MTETAVKDVSASAAEEGEVEDLHVPTSWEFIEKPPTVDVVKAKLKSLGLVWGLHLDDFVEYVQPLAQSKNVSIVKGVKDYKNVFTLYFTVAGRVAMINAAAEQQGWRVDFVPEPVTPTGIPGYLQYDARIVYREYVEIWHQFDPGGDADVEWVLLGRKPGTAWVPGTGGAGAVESNRFEKVETSARGRALGAWGIGVIPGSGVASLDEMQSVRDLRGAERGQGAAPEAGRNRVSREEMESQLRIALADFQRVTGMEDVAMDDRTQQFVQRTFGKELQADPKGGWSFANMKEGELAVFMRTMQGQLARAQAEAQGQTS